MLLWRRVNVDLECDTWMILKYHTTGEVRSQIFPNVNCFIFQELHASFFLCWTTTKTKLVDVATMGNVLSSDVPEVQYGWNYRAAKKLTDTTPIVSGDGSTVAVYSRDEKAIHVLDGPTGTTVCSIPLQQKAVLNNVSAIPSITHDGSKIITRDVTRVRCFDRKGNELWFYDRPDKIPRSGIQPWIAQISANGKVVIVRMFHELIWLDGDTGAVTATTSTKRQNATSIPRISDDGTTVVMCDATTLTGFVNGKPIWTAKSPYKKNGFGGNHWGDPALSADGSVCAVIGNRNCHIFDAKTGLQIGQIAEVRHRHHESRNGELDSPHFRRRFCRGGRGWANAARLRQQRSGEYTHFFFYYIHQL